MAGKHRKTYDAIFSRPVRGNIAWNDAVAMAEAFGARVVPGGGSMFTFALGGVSAVIHRAPPGRRAEQGAGPGVPGLPRTGGGRSR